MCLQHTLGVWRVICLICTPEGWGWTYQAGHECLCYNYYVTLPFHASGFIIFIVVLIAFDCGFELWRLFYVFNTSTIVLIYQQREGTVLVGTNIHYKPFTWCIKPLYSGWLYVWCALFKTYLKRLLLANVSLLKFTIMSDNTIATI